MSYGLFISYSRRDNQSERIMALKERIEADYRAFVQEELRCFFDLVEIHGMDDWRHRILRGLRESQLLLSPGCLDRRVPEVRGSRAAAGRGLAPVYFVDVSGLDTPGFEQTAAWVMWIRRRNHFGLH